jgi:hypothetical protein
LKWKLVQGGGKQESAGNQHPTENCFEFKYEAVASVWLSSEVLPHLDDADPGERGARQDREGFARVVILFFVVQERESIAANIYDC